MKDARVSPRWVDYRSQSNPHGLRFIEGEDGGTTPPKPAPPAGNAGDKAGDPKPEPSAPNADGDEPLGDGGKRALEAEREARRALEGQVTQMREAFATALGTKPDKKASVEDMVSQLQEQFSTMQRATLVSAIARENEITKADDIALIEDAATEEGMRRIAARLKAAAESAPGTPKPDRSQGGTGETAPPESLPGVPRMAQAFEQEFAKSNH